MWSEERCEATSNEESGEEGEKTYFDMTSLAGLETEKPWTGWFCVRDERGSGRPCRARGSGKDRRTRRVKLSITPLIFTLKNLGLVTPPLDPSPSHSKAPWPSSLCPPPLKVTSWPDTSMSGPSQLFEPNVMSPSASTGGSKSQCCTKYGSGKGDRETHGG